MPPDGSLAIATRQLTKHFSGVAAVDHVDLEVPAGSVFGFLGPNGSGKTTTIRMLLGLIGPTEGTWQLLGEDMPAAIEHTLPEVGALVEGPAFYPWLSGRDNLARIDAAGPDGRRSTRKARIDDALTRVGLTAAAAKKYRAYSLGMRQRLGLASALLRPRRLLVLDEPTNGMDPQGTREIRHLIRDLASDGTTVFLSSHLLTEVEAVCTHAAVMSRGQLLAQGTMESLRATSVARLRVEVDQPVRAIEILTAAGVEAPTAAGNVVTGGLPSAGDAGRAGTTNRKADPAAGVGGPPPGVEAPTPEGGTAARATPEECNRALVLAGVAVRSLTTERPSLEDLFVALTGEGFDVDR